MRPALRRLLQCPACGGKLEATPFITVSDELIEGVLSCACGCSYPVVDTIPRMLENAYELFPEFAARHGDRLARGPAHRTVSPGSKRSRRLLARTQGSFGYQWTTFSQMACDFQENFWNYLRPATPEFFRGRLGLDAGCGFGRHLYHAASCGAEMVGVDFSRAIDATRRNTERLPNVHLVQADIYRLPFAEETFDFIYSIGVLHHLPDPARGLQSLEPLLKPGGSLFVWLYSSKRRIVNFLLETVRLVTTRLPHRLVHALSWIGAAVDWYGFVLPYRALSRLPALRPDLERLTPSRIKVYSRYPFQVLYADWFDRLAAPIRFYYDEAGAKALVASAGLSEIQVVPTGLYGWRACGVKRGRSDAAATGGGRAQAPSYAT